MQSPVLRSPQIHQGTPNLIKDQHKHTMRSPTIDMLKKGVISSDSNTTSNTPETLKKGLTTNADNIERLKKGLSKTSDTAMETLKKEFAKTTSNTSETTRVKASPFSSIVTNKKKFFKAVKFNQQFMMGEEVGERRGEGEMDECFDSDENNNNGIEQMSLKKPKKKLLPEDDPPKHQKEKAKKKGKGKGEKEGREEGKEVNEKCTPPADAQRKFSFKDVDSPIAPAMVKAREQSNLTGTEVEKLLVERLLIRKDLKLQCMQERLQEIHKEMDQIKENHAKIVEELEKESKEKDEEILRLQKENSALSSLPGISILIFLSYLISIFKKTAIFYQLFFDIFKKIVGCPARFYMWVFNMSADWTEIFCYFLEYNAIKLRWKLEEIRTKRKTNQSPNPKSNLRKNSIIAKTKSNVTKRKKKARKS